ncbi:MAG: ribose-5-phosphate isomerase RpiA [Pseudomonadota bacterium]
MSGELSPIDRAKYVAAKRAVEFVEDGMRVGLGTGSTAAWMVRHLAEVVHDEGMQISCVATSSRTAELARKMKLQVTTLDEVKWLDLTIDGADEFDPQLNLIKGGGGALLQEKIVATASDRMIVITDVSKQVAQLGHFPLPVEVVPFGWETTKTLIEETLINLSVVGRTGRLRLTQNGPFVSDEGNYIVDLDLLQIENPRQVSLVLNQIPGVVENGLFIDICDMVLIGNSDATVEIRDINSGSIKQEQVEVATSTNVFSDL